jgi:tetratricopeptide (TPR) repeat protein
VSALRVISRTSVMAFKGAHEPLPEIARKLGVDAVVEGTVARAGERVRVSADLVQAHPEKSLWSDRYDRDLRDALAIQSEVAQAIAEQVKAQLTPRERAQLARSKSRRVDPAAQDEFLKGRYFLNRVSDTGYRAAIAHFQKAIELDPSHAAAWAGLSDAYYGISNVFLPPNEAMPKAREAAKKALELDPELGGAHLALGLVQAQYDFQWADAESSYVRALRLDPSESLAHLGYMFLLEETGRPAESIAQGQEAIRLDPLSQFAQGQTAYAYYLAGRYAESKQRYEAMVRADSTYAVPYYSIALCDLELRLPDEAFASLRRAESIGDIVFARVMQVYALAVVGRRAEAYALMDTIRADPAARWSNCWSAWIYGAAGDLDRAFAAVDKALEAHDEDLAWIQLEPKFKYLRGDPRYPALLKRMGFRP